MRKSVIIVGNVEHPCLTPNVYTLVDCLMKVFMRTCCDVYLVMPIYVAFLFLTFLMQALPFAVSLTNM